MQPGSLEEFYVTKGLAQRKPRTVKWFHRRIFLALEQMVLGQLPNGAKNLLICIPPRHGKTDIIQAFVEWCFGWFPDAKFIYTGYNLDIATESSRPILETLKTDWYLEIFRHGVVDKSCRMREDQFDTKYGGGLKAAGVNGPITGFGAGQKRPGFAGAIVIDDALKASDFRSEAVRGSCNRWYTETLSSRVNKDETPKVMIAQRGHPEDLPGFVLANEPGLWHVVEIPAVEGDIDSDGCRILWPEVKSRESLKLLKAVDEHTYFAQYQQKPQREGGNIIKSGWWKNHDYELGTWPKGLLFITADTAYKKTKTADYSSLQLWCATQSHLDLLDKMHGKWEFPELLQNAVEFYKKWNKYGVRALFIEDKASGTSLEQTLRLQGYKDEHGKEHKIPAVAWKPSDYNFPDDKVGRVRESTWYIHAGRVRLPGYMDNQPFIDECSAFAEDMSHSHDDQVDTMTMGISIWRYHGGGADVQTA